MSRRSVWIALAIYLLATGWLYGPAFREGVRETVPTLPSTLRMHPIVRADHQWAVWSLAGTSRPRRAAPPGSRGVEKLRT